MASNVFQLLSELAFNCEILNLVLEGKEISKEQAYQIFQISEKSPKELFETAKKIRNKNQGKIITFSKKAR